MPWLKVIVLCAYHSLFRGLALGGGGCCFVLALVLSGWNIIWVFWETKTNYELDQNSINRTPGMGGEKALFQISKAILFIYWNVLIQTWQWKIHFNLYYIQINKQSNCYAV